MEEEGKKMAHRESRRYTREEVKEEEGGPSFTSTPSRPIRERAIMSSK